MSLDALKKILIERGEWEGELVHTTADGREIPVESRWALQKDAEGRPTGFLEINRDITLKKKAEEEIAAYVEKLKNVNRDLQDFAFVASHDLQEPLRKIQVFGEMLQKEHSDRLDDQGMEFLKRMQSAAVRMQALINSLLQYSRLNTRPEPFTAVDLRATALQAAEVFELILRNSRGRVEIADLPTIEADPNQMAQLFQNLIGNALKFHGEADPVVEISAECGETNCRIRVEDNGIGFDMRYLDKIFQPFQRLHGRSEYEGTGMGLAICRKIVERHGGSLTAKSEPGRGAAFIIDLPLRQK
jgi:light-regulated signal transduction histidine kinase (bacteriophytochrome)